jgi:hypothetical protein
MNELPLLPAPSTAGPPEATLLFAAAMAALLVSLASQRICQRMPRTGLFPSLLRGITALSRAALVPLVLFGALALAPPAWRWAEPFVLIAVAAALGWTTRDLMGDLFAGIVLAVERPLARGDRITHEGRGGRVVDVGLRVTRLVCDDGTILTLPNRQVTRGALHTDPDPFPHVSVPIHISHELHLAHIRQTLEELALLSPWLAPARPPRVYRDPDREDVWVIEARVVHARYANAFRGALVELADEVFRDA